MTLTIGSLFSGYEGLGMAVQQVLDAEIAWVCDNDPAAAKVLAHHYPNVPNLGDITAVDWDTVEPVDIICGGSPCQDVSAAGRRAGMKPGTRSGLWTSMANAIAALRPQLVVFENVRGILSAEAHCDVEPCPWHLGGSGDGEPSLRALGRVLGDLADLGFDAEWTGLPASDIGAPHKRWREFLIAWPADAHAPSLRRQRGGQHGNGGLDLRTAVAALPRADGAAGSERRLAAPGQAEGGRPRPDAGGRGGAPADLSALGVGRMLPTPRATDGTNGGPNQRGSKGDLMLSSAVALLPTPDATHGRKTTRTGPLLPGITDWGPFANAIARWEAVLGRPAPNPRDDKGRLSPAFVEWMMGLPAGWVTDVQGLSRNELLRLLGNGVVPQQCATALPTLLAAWSAACGLERAS